MTHDGFLQDICEHPDDDAPRLIYADWLEDNGDPVRAQFIRVQCELTRLPPGDARHAELTEQEAMLGEQQDRWLAELPRFAGIRWEGFARGFVESISVFFLKEFLDQAPSFFRATPIRSLRIARDENVAALRALADCSYLARLTELNLGNRFVGAAVLLELLGKPDLANLTSLLLHQNGLGDEGVQVLAEGLRLPQLRQLYLSGNGIGDAGAAVLAASPHFPALTDLDLRDNGIGDGGVTALATCPHWPNLSSLFLVNNWIGDAGTRALAESPNLPQLRYLYLNHNLVAPIGDDGARALACSPLRANLRELDLRNCDIGDAGAQAVAESPYLNNLTKLYLRAGNNIRSREIIRLLEQRFGRVLRG